MRLAKKEGVADGEEAVFISLLRQLELVGVCWKMAAAPMDRVDISHKCSNVEANEEAHEYK